MRPPLADGEEAVYSLGVVAPERSGAYRLRVTLVQEWVSWWDAFSPAVADETTLTVVPAVK